MRDPNWDSRTLPFEEYQRPFERSVRELSDLATDDPTAIIDVVLRKTTRCELVDLALVSDHDLPDLVTRELAEPYLIWLAVVDVAYSSQWCGHYEFCVNMRVWVELPNSVTPFECSLGKLDLSVGSFPDRAREWQRCSE